MVSVVYIFLLLCTSVYGISDLRRCADAKCEEPISYGVAKFRYVPSESDKIYAKPGDRITIYSKEAGNDTTLWGVEIDGRRGYLPKDSVKEDRVLHKKLDYIVPTKADSSIVENTPGIDTQEGSASTVISHSKPVSVVDGTTIYDVNTTGEVLETQPIETAFNNEINVGIHFSKNIDATSVSKNKLDEPNSSLILPQPTTSEASVHNGIHHSSYDISEEAKILKEIEESSSQYSETDNGEKLIASDVSESENESSNKDNIEEIEKPKDMEANFIDALKEKDDEIDEEEDWDDEDSDDDEEPTENEDEYENEEGQVGQLHEVRTISEEMGKDDNEHEISSTTNKLEPLDTYISGPNISASSTENLLLLKSEQTNTNSESADKDFHNRDSEKVVNMNSPEMQLFSGSALESSVVDTKSQQIFNVRENLNDARNSIITNSEYEKDDNLRSRTTEEGETSEIISSSFNDANKETADGASVSSNTFMDLKSMNLNNLQGEKVKEEQKEAIFSGFPSLGVFNKIEKREDIDQGKEENTQKIPTSDTSDVPVVTENVISEESSVDLLKNNRDHQAEDSSEERSQQDSDPQEREEQEFVKSGEGYEQQNPLTSASQENENQANHRINEEMTAEATSEVLGTCEVDTLGCVPESENLPEQLSSSEQEQPGWFSFLSGSTSLRSELPSISLNQEMHKNSFDALLYLMVTAITVLVFSLGYYYIEKQRRDGVLMAKISNLEKSLMVSSQEKYTLKNELDNAKEKLSTFITSTDNGETVSLLKDELADSRNARSELEEHVASLEKELEAATEAGLELNRMMSELLSAQHGSDTLMKSVEHLQKQLDTQQSTISTMTANLSAKKLENENLLSELHLASERAHILEEQLAKALENKSADSQRLCHELNDLQDVLDETRKTLAAREGEVTVLRECLNHAECLSNGGDSRISLEDILSVGHLRAKMDLVTKERDELQERLLGEEDARKLLEDHMKIVSEEVSTLRAKYEEADRGKMEAQTRLEVLSNYFKEKETQLQKELGLQEAMYIKKEGDALSTVEQIKAFQEEIENYKAQNEILKKEIVDQERSMKSQIAMLEKKAHENWVAARQAERRMDESKQESSQLRNRLTLSGRRVVGTLPIIEGGKPERGTLELEHNGEMPSSPAHLGETQELPSSPLHFGISSSPHLLPPAGQPLPPGPFPGLPLFLPPGAPGMPFPLPPPPGGLFPDDLRPPPLGRMSSPPPEPRNSFSPFDHSPPMSPPGRPYRSSPHFDDLPSRYRHQTPPSSSTPSFTSPFSSGKWDEHGDPPRSSFRPLHRDSPREPKGSALSSDHSSESLDKGSRHSCV